MPSTTMEHPTPKPRRRRQNLGKTAAAASLLMAQTSAEPPRPKDDTVDYGGTAAPPPPPSDFARIFGGRPTLPGSYPFLASLQAPTRLGQDGSWEGWVHACGATVVAPDVLLTAAHCGRTTARAVIGLRDLDDGDDDGSTGAQRWVTREVAHPDYDTVPTSAAGRGNDIMLIKLSEPTYDHPSVRLNLNDASPAQSGDPLTVAGWGVTDFVFDPARKKYVPVTASVLQQATVGYIPNYVCERSYEGMIDGSMMCAAGQRTDACQGDSGGPLLLGGVGSAGELVQAGVVSFGIGCADRDFPGVYSRISSQLDWIVPTLCDLSDDPPAYLGCGGSFEPMGEKDTTGGEMATWGEITPPLTPPPTPSPTPPPTPPPTAAPDPAQGRRRRRRRPNQGR